MPDEVTAERAAADEDEKNTREGFAHKDHTETADQTRGALQRWGANTPGQNTLEPTGVSPASEDVEHPSIG